MDAESAADEVTRIAPRRNWSGVTAVIAALVGLLALGVSAYTAYLQRQQVRAQVWPLLLPGTSNARHEVVVLNKGMGPAIVKSVKLLVDGKPQRNWHGTFDALGLKFGAEPLYSTLNGIVVSPGERISQLTFASAEDYNLFASRAERINMQLCYCSTLDECWLIDDRQRDVAHGLVTVDACPADGPDEFHDNESFAPAPLKEGK